MIADIWKQLRRRPMSLLGFSLIGFFFIVAVSAPLLAPPAPNARDAFIIPQDGYSPDPVRPSKKHIFGTTEQQYDLYYGMVWGTRTAFRVAITVVAIALIIGILVGGAAGFYGGWIDEVLMRFTDIILAFPDLVLAVVIVSTVFDFPGIGRWGVVAAQQLDVPGVLGSTLLAAFLFVLANLVSDMLYALVDPRIRIG
ncbi:MAG: hypothetical protein A3J74_10595 [Elusimicrobia bacterium RIFCSPHIGHO2_02_FULL_57_9]|nr:MAG: hypothetical protein A3J74_10595 [Elusimicrobia bacterium RIFCSPHIGHO2_02_FULL_57_9]